MSTFSEQIVELVHSGHALLHVSTREEARAVQQCRMVAAALGADFSTWNALDTRDPLQLLDVVSAARGPSVTVLLDFHAALLDVRVTRRIRTLASSPAAQRVLVLVGALLEIPPELREEFRTVRLPLPDRGELSELLNMISEVSLDAQTTHRAVNAACGLTAEQARRAFNRALGVDGRMNARAVQCIIREKTAMLASDVGLESVDVSEGLDAMGGLQGYKAWLKERAQAFEPGAAAYGLTPPKGVLLVGVQGCGKSMSARCAAALLEVPLLRLDLPMVLGTSASTAEENLTRAIAATEAVAPVALWIDEIEKGFAGTSPGQGSDTRASRLLGAMSTWLQERKASVFVIATANDVSRIPPELLRRGRFDELFFVDLPDCPERQDILRLHLQRRGQDLPSADLLNLARDCAEYSGAELEQVVIGGLHRALAHKRALTVPDLKRVAQDMVPLARTYEEQIKGLREWARHRTRPAGRENAVVELFKRAPAVA